MSSENKMPAPSKPTKTSDTYYKFRDDLEKMDESQLDGLDFRHYSRDMKRLITREKKLRKEKSSPKDTTDLLMKMVEVLRPDQAAEFKDRYQNPPKIPNAKRPRKTPKKERTPNAPSDIPPGKKESVPKGVAVSGKGTTPKPKRAYHFKEYHEDISKKVQDISYTTKFWTLDLKSKVSIAGSFLCCNIACNKEWEDRAISVIIRGSHGPEILEYNVFAYDRNCRKCGFLAVMNIKKTNFINLVTRQLRRWKEEFQPPSRHDLGYCEGCKTRNCPKLKTNSLGNKYHLLL
ncbi:hypothetical protein TWF506_008269 [Arthrobotrys conoides]|uniref:3CxxC-type domain-containing protein n=1 Tax=Arthrobotrys conoides TaxID=74498 RepID=A0AAN8N917_9PEZI